MLPRLLDRLADRPVMLTAAGALAALTLGHGAWSALGGPVGWEAFLLLWAASGAAYAAILTPTGRLLRASAHAEDRPALFAAQFAPSHAAWLLTYPLAGWAGVAVGLPAAMAVLGAVAAAGALAAARVWPGHDPASLAHDHADLPPDHPHLAEYGRAPHEHVYVIDDHHPAWPRTA